MGKKLLVILLSLTASLTAIFGLTACGDEGGACEHEYTTLLERKSATCLEDGNLTIQSCNKCGKYYVKETFKEYDDYDEAYSKAIDPKKGHTHTWVDKQEPSSCTSIGYFEHYKCDRCDAVFTTEKQETTLEELKIVGEHNITYQGRVYASCTQAGTYEHYKCTSCGDLFQDAYGNVKLTQEDVIENPSHYFSNGYHEYQAPTCTTAGNVEYYYCWNCYKYYADENGQTELDYNNDVIIPALEHDLSNVSTLVEADCDIDEVKRHSCARVGCGYYEDVTTENSALVHNFASGKCTNCSCDEFSLGLEMQESGYWSGDEYVPTYTVYGLGDWVKSDVLIFPNTYKGAKVTKVTLWSEYFNLDGVKKIIIPENVEEVSICSYLQGKNTSVKEIVIKSHSLYLDSNAFANLTALDTFTTPSDFTFAGISGAAFYGCSSLKSFTIKGRFNVIDNQLFQGCSSLENVVIDAPITHISDRAFISCTSLKEIYIPSTVTYIGDYAFDKCTSLEKVIVDDVKDWAKIIFSTSSNPLTYAHHFYKKTDTGAIPYGDIVIDSTFFTPEILEKDTKIDSYMFSGCYDIVKVALPSGITEIYNNAFENCINLKEVELHPYSSNSGYTLTRINACAFKGCSSLEKLTYPASISYVGSKAFEGCDAITSIYYSKTKLTEWINTSFSDVYANPMHAGNADVYLFNGLIYGTTAELGADLTPADGEPYALKPYVMAGFKAPIKGIEFLSEIGEYAFYNAKGVIGTVILTPEAGYNASSLPDNYKGVSKIGRYAFANCQNLTGAVLPTNNAVRVYEYAFAGSGIRTFTVPDKSASVSYNVLKGCNKLEYLGLADPYCNHVYDYFGGTSNVPSSLKTLNLGYDTISSYELEGLTSLENLYLPSGARFLDSYCFGYEANKRPTKINIFYGGTLEEFMTNGLFCSSDRLPKSNLYTHEYVETLPSGKDRYEYKLLQDLVIPENVTSIRSFAFTNVVSLQSVTLPSTFNPNNIGSHAFYNCDNLFEVYNYTGYTLTTSSSSYGYLTKYASAIYTQEGEERRVAITSDGFAFTLSDDETPIVYMFKYLGDGGDVTLPSTVTIGSKTYDSYEIGSRAFYFNDKIESVVIPSSVTSINENAFYGSSNLTSITFNEGLTYIGSSAFAVTNISRVVLPNSVTSVNKSAFYDCDMLYQIVLGKGLKSFSMEYKIDKLIEIVDPNNVSDVEVPLSSSTSQLIIEGDYVFANLNGELNLIAYTGEGGELTLPVKDGGYKIYKNFMRGGEVTKLTIPDCVTEIGAYAFEKTPVQEVVIGNGVKVIGDHAFGGASNLSLITLGSSVETIKTHAFYNCANVEELVLPASLKTLEESAFYKTNFGKIVFSENCVPTIANYFNVTVQEVHVKTLNQLLRTYNKSGLFLSGASLYIDGALAEEITITGDDCDYISYNMFNRIVGLKKVTIDGVDRIEQWAFTTCSLEEVIIKNVNYIGYQAFYSCDDLTKITLENVKEIGDEAFSINNGDGEVNMSGVEVVGDRAFYNYSIVKGGLGNSLEYVGDEAFYYSFSDKVTIPSTIEYVGKNAFSGCDEQESQGSYYLGNEENPYLVLVRAGKDSETDTVIINEGCKVIAGDSFNNVSVTSITLPSGLVGIGASAFKGKGLTEINIPSTVKYIGDYAFSETAIQTVLIPRDIIYLGEHAFLACANLSEVIFDVDTTLKEIERYAFDGCYNLTSVSLPMSIEVIKEGALYNTGLTSIVLGSNVKVIESQSIKKVDTLVLSSIETYLNLQLDDEEASPVFSWDTSNYGKILVQGVELTEIVVPESVTHIGDYLFYGNPYIKKFTGHDKLESIGRYAFYNSALEEIDLKGTKYVDYNAFYSCDSLKTITMTSVEELETDAFYNANAVETLTISNSLKKVNEYAFENFTASVINFLGTPDDWASIEFESFSDNIANKGTFKFNGEEITELILSVNVKPFTFYHNDSITKVTLLDSVTEVGAYAFENAESLVEVHLGNGVTKIGNKAFYECTALTTVTVGESLEEIGNYAFADCYKLATFDSLKSVKYIGDSAFYQVKLTELDLTSVITVGEQGFSCSTMTKVTLGNNFESAGNNAFYFTNNYAELYYLGELNDWVSMEFVNSYSNPAYKADKVYYNGQTGMEVTITAKELRPFSLYSADVSKITLSDNVEVIGKYALARTKATEIVLGSGVKEVGEGAFAYGSSVKKVTLNGSFNEIPKYAFYENRGVEEIVIPSGVIKIGEQAFYNAEKLRRLILSDTVEVIGSEALYKVNLDLLHIGKNLNTLAVDAFSDDYSIKEITIDPENQNFVIYNGGLYDKDLTILYYQVDKSYAQIVLPETLKIICEGAFRDHTALTTIVIPESVEEIGNRSFLNCERLVEVCNLSSAGLGYSYLTEYALNVYGASGSSKITTDGDMIFYNDGSARIFVAYVGDGVELVIPEGVTRIYNYAFYNSSVAKVTYPSTLTTVDSYAFEDSNVSEFVIYGGQISLVNEYICEHLTIVSGAINKAYESNRVLKTLVIKNGVTSICQNAFQNSSALEEVTLGSGITSLPYYAFGTVRKITMGAVTSFGNGSVIGADEIYYGGTIEQWATATFTGSSLPISKNTKLYVGETLVTDVNLNVETISANAFNSYSYLRTLILGDSVKTIGENAFRNAIHLTHVTIGSSVTTSGAYSFDGNEKLADVYNRSAVTVRKGYYDLGRVAENAVNLYTSSSDKKIKYDGDFAYLDYDYRKILVDYAGGETTVTVPTGITELGEEALYSLGIEKLTLPATVTKIGYWGARGVEELYLENAQNWYWCYNPSFDYEDMSTLVQGDLTDPVVAATAFSTNSGAYYNHVTNGDFVTRTENSNVILIDYLGSITEEGETTLVIPEGITELGYESLAHLGSANKNISITVKFPSTLKRIQQRAFFWYNGYCCIRKIDVGMLNSGWYRAENNEFISGSYMSGDFTDMEIAAQAFAIDENANKYCYYRR
jgi:hypothetical protein